MKLPINPLQTETCDASLPEPSTDSKTRLDLVQGPARISMIEAREGQVRELEERRDREETCAGEETLIEATGKNTTKSRGEGRGGGGGGLFQDLQSGSWKNHSQSPRRQRWQREPQCQRVEGSVGPVVVLLSSLRVKCSETAGP